MSLLHVIILAIIQGMAELLPVSSSAHVVVAEKLMGMDPTSPTMTLLLVMLHTGTMFAVIAYFWKQWRATYFRDARTFKTIVGQLFVASFVTAIIGYGLIEGIEKLVLQGKHAQVEELFGRLDLIAPALAAVGILILIAGLRHSRENASGAREDRVSGSTGLNMNQAGWIGGIQGLCLPFRGFSRSGATISTGMLLGVAKARAEEFSFALAVILTPPAIAREVWRLMKAQHLAGSCPDRQRHDAELAGDDICLPGWAAGSEMAEPVAGKRALVLVRDLLPDRGGCGGVFAPHWVLKRLPSGTGKIPGPKGRENQPAFQGAKAPCSLRNADCKCRGECPGLKAAKISLSFRGLKPPAPSEMPSANAGANARALNRLRKKGRIPD